MSTIPDEPTLPKLISEQIISGLNNDNFSISKIISDCKQVGIYILFKDGVAVYVGQGMFPLERIGKHTRDKDFNAFKIIPVAEGDVSDVEAALIAALMPMYNKSLPKCGLYISERDACMTYSISHRKIKELADLHAIKPIKLGSWSYYLRQDLNKAIKGGAA